MHKSEHISCKGLAVIMMSVYMLWCRMFFGQREYAIEFSELNICFAGIAKYVPCFFTSSCLLVICICISSIHTVIC